VSARAIAFALALLAITTSLAQAVPQSGKDQAHQSWDACTRADDPNHLRTEDVAIAGCTAVIKSGEPKEVDQTDAYFHRANSYARAGQYANAIADYDVVIKRKPDYTLAYLYRAQVSDKHKPGTGSADFVRAFKINAIDTLSWSFDDYVARQEWNSAIANYTQALALHTNDALVLKFRGDIYDTKGDFALAITDYSKALELDPKLVVVHLDRGLAYYHQKNLQAALADFNAGVAADPTNASALNARCRILIELGRFQDALADCDKAVEMMPDQAVVWINRGDAHFKLAQWKLAAADYDGAVKAEPEVAAALYARGLAKLKDRDPTGKADIDNARRMQADVETITAKRGIKP
jgi:tetratricopeptide (TPR) repeat protein